MSLLENHVYNSSFFNEKSKISKTETSTVQIICKKCEISKVMQHCISNNSLCSPYNCLLVKHLNGFSKLEAVVSLTLSGCNLNSLPNCLNKFNVKEVNLSHNNFVEVPEILINCKKLEKLDFSWNKLKKFDVEPVFVQRLRYLNLEHNTMMEIPEWILSVQSFNLEELNYNYNKVKDFSSANFHKVSHYELKKLELQNCYLIDDDMKFLKSIRTLKSLNISNNKHHNNLNKFIKCDTLFNKPLWVNTITILRLNQLQLSVIPPEINSFASLEELEVSENYLMWLPEQLCDLKKLKWLDVSHNNLIGVPENLTKLRNLQTLKAAHNQIATLQNLYLLTNLCYLDLYHNELDMVNEVNINSLKYIDLEFNCFLSKDMAWFNLEEYESKKAALRCLVSENRADGPKTVSHCVEDEYSGGSSSEIDYENTYCLSSNQYNELDNWDDENCNYSDNGCTASDNEWKGCENSKKVKNRIPLKKWPSRLFEDAME